MLTLNDIPYFYKLVGSILLAMLFFGIAMILIKKSTIKRQKDAEKRQRDSLIPFPQTARLPENAHVANLATAEERAETIRQHYKAYLERYILPTHDGRAAFVRVGVERKRLRYQVTTTSLAQSLSMIHAVLMAGDDLNAGDRFERLLTFLIAYPSNQSEDLSTWYTLPDMTAPPKLEADPHAEVWIAYSLLLAEKQWGKGDIFNYDKVLDYRLAALLNLQKEIEAGEHKRAIYAPAFFEAFAERNDREAWQNIADGMRKELLNHIKDVKLVGDGSSEEAWLALSALHVGLAGLWSQGEKQQKLVRAFEPLVYDSIKTLAEHLPENEGDGLSALALLSCLAPLAMQQNDQDLVNRYWQTLSKHKSAERDAIGESLRVIALMALDGTFWALNE